MLRVLLVVEPGFATARLRKLFTGPGWKACGAARNGREAVTRAHALQPDAVVLDASMLELNGVAAARQILASRPCVLVALLPEDSPQLIAELYRAGVRGCVLKTEAERALKPAILAGRKGRNFASSGITGIVLADADLHVADVLVRLTPRELEILRLIAAGRSNREVAEILGVSVGTVETHRANMMDKLDVHSIAELVRFAIRNHLITP